MLQTTESIDQSNTINYFILATKAPHRGFGLFNFFNIFAKIQEKMTRIQAVHDHLNSSPVGARFSQPTATEKFANTEQKTGLGHSECTVNLAKLTQRVMLSQWSSHYPTVPASWPCPSLDLQHKSSVMVIMIHVIYLAERFFFQIDAQWVCMSSYGGRRVDTVMGINYSCTRSNGDKTKETVPNIAA